eukprot:759836-Hanusia_phi.AAC.1
MLVRLKLMLPHLKKSRLLLRIQPCTPTIFLSSPCYSSFASSSSSATTTIPAYPRPLPDPPLLPPTCLNTSAPELKSDRNRLFHSLPLP